MIILTNRLHQSLKYLSELIKQPKELKNIPVLLDTGADISLLPLSAIKTLQIQPLSEIIKLVGFDKSNDVFELYELQVVFLGKRFFGKFCAIDDEVGIIGRDVLNQVSILFDGKNLEWGELL
jgi:predicted aspartyl protease